MAIKHKIALSFSLLLILVMAAFWLSLKLQLEQTLSQQTDTLGQILSKQTADSVTELVLANDLLGLKVVAGQLAQEPGVANVTITDVDGRILASTLGESRLAELDSKAYLAPITLQGAVAGSVILHLDETLVNNPVARPNTLFFVIVAAGLVLVLATSYALAAHVTNPLLQLLEQTGMDEGDEEIEIVIDRNDEIGLLQQRFAELCIRQRELEDQIELIGLPEVDGESMSGLKAERRMATLLVVQVANSNTAIELLHPSALSTLLQQYQFYLRQAARLYGGIVTRINGDSALVSFDARRCQDEHAFNALCCAQLFMRLMRKVAADQRARHAQALEFSLAIHSGDVYFSPVWKKAKPGEEKTRQESVIGAPVVLANELLQHSHAGEILVSELSYDMADGNERFATDVTRQVTVGADKLVLMTYSLSPDTGPHSELLERQCQHLLPDQQRASLRALPQEGE